MELVIGRICEVGRLQLLVSVINNAGFVVVNGKLDQETRTFRCLVYDLGDKGKLVPPTEFRRGLCVSAVRMSLGTVSLTLGGEPC